MVTGNITLFHTESDGDNPPVLKGEIVYSDGTKDYVTLWRNTHPRVTKGEFFKGKLYNTANK